MSFLRFLGILLLTELIYGARTNRHRSRYPYRRRLRGARSGGFRSSGARSGSRSSNYKNGKNTQDYFLTFGINYQWNLGNINPNNASVPYSLFKDWMFNDMTYKNKEFGIYDITDTTINQENVVYNGVTSEFEETKTISYKVRVKNKLYRTKKKKFEKWLDGEYPSDLTTRMNAHVVWVYNDGININSVDINWDTKNELSNQAIELIISFSIVFLIFAYLIGKHYYKKGCCDGSTTIGRHSKDPSNIDLDNIHGNPTETNTKNAIDNSTNNTNTNGNGTIISNNNDWETIDIDKKPETNGGDITTNDPEIPEDNDVNAPTDEAPIPPLTHEDSDVVFDDDFN